MKIDFEVKVFVFISCVAALKLLKADTENPDHILYARVFFGVFHFFFLVIFAKTKATITSMMATQDKKLEYGASLWEVVKGVLMKAIVISGVHWKTNMIQPLVISSIMGFMSLLECHLTFNEVASVLPFLFVVKKNKNQEKKAL